MFQKFLKVIASSFIFAVQIHSVPNSTNEEIFTKEYEKPLYVDQNPISFKFLSFINDLKRDYGISKIIDAGCGNARWSNQLLPGMQYIGFDIVEAIVKNNIEAADSAEVHFIHLDMTQEMIPQGDLILCKECFEWFSYYDIYVTLENMKASRSTYLLASTFAKLSENQESSTGIRRAINFEAPPFHFPPPLEMIHEENGSTKELALWKLDEIDLSKLYQAIFPPITVLSKPVGGPFRWEHAGVMNSLRRGLGLRHREFNVNIDNLDLVKPNVVVVADLQAGLQAYKWKEKKQIETLMVGPNIIKNVSENNSFIAWPLIDAFLSPSEWPKNNFIRFNPLLQNRIQVWFAGVDETYWKPDEKFKKKDNKKVLVYRKTNPDISDHVEKILRSKGFSVVSVSYGSYSPHGYKTLLSECQFAVFVSCSESQGIALAEAWSMDVPTLVWNPRGSVFYEGYEYQNTSAAPYLNPMVGEEWQTWDEFHALLLNFNKDPSVYQPRRWVLLNMTDKVSAQSLINIVRDIRNTRI